jgi:hypothetical protein
MTCPYYEQITDAYLKGEINDSQWQQHLSECSTCKLKVQREVNFDLVVRRAVSGERIETYEIEARVRAAIRNLRTLE